jgi:hypothetical protein
MRNGFAHFNIPQMLTLVDILHGSLDRPVAASLKAFALSSYPVGSGIFQTHITLQPSPPCQDGEMPPAQEEVKGTCMQPSAQGSVSELKESNGYHEGMALRALNTKQPQNCGAS